MATPIDENPYRELQDKREKVRYRLRQARRAQREASDQLQNIVDEDVSEGAEQVRLTLRTREMQALLAGEAAQRELHVIDAEIEQLQKDRSAPPSVASGSDSPGSNRGENQVKDPTMLTGVSVGTPQEGVYYYELDSQSSKLVLCQSSSGKDGVIQVASRTAQDPQLLSQGNGQPPHAPRTAQHTSQSNGQIFYAPGTAQSIPQSNGTSGVPQLADSSLQGNKANSFGLHIPQSHGTYGVPQLADSSLQGNKANSFGLHHPQSGPQWGDQQAPMGSQNKGIEGGVWGKSPNSELFHTPFSSVSVPPMQGKPMHSEHPATREQPLGRVFDSKIRLPKLGSQDQLPAFLKRIEQQLLEIQWAVRVDGAVMFYDSVTLVNRIIDAMEACPAVYRTAIRLVEKHAPTNWGVIHKALVERYCDRTMLRIVAEERLRKLSLESNSPEVVEAFLLDCDDALGTYERVYPDDQQSRFFKKKLLEDLPVAVRDTVRLQLANMTNGEDIESADFEVIKRAVRWVCKSLGNIRQFQRDRTKSANQPQTIGSGRKSPAVEFAKRFKCVLVAYTSIDLDKKHVANALEILRVEGPKGAWYALGFDKEQNPQAVKTQLRGLDTTAEVRPWKRYEARRDGSKPVFEVNDGCSRVPDPIILKAYSEGEKLELMIDSGAGGSYATISPSSWLQDRCYEGEPKETELADGSIVRVNTFIDLEVEVETLNGERVGPFIIRFNILSRNANGDGHMLCGRVDMEKMGTTITSKHGLQCYIDDKCVFQASPLFLPKLDRALRVSELGNCQKGKIDAALEELVKSEWVPIPMCVGFSVRLRGLRPDEPKDPGTQQRYVWEVKLPKNVTTQTNLKNDYEQRLFQRLDDLGKQQHSELVKKYEDAGYWWTTEREDHANFEILPGAPVFMTYSGHDDTKDKKPRLVCDLREANLSYQCQGTMTGVVDYIGGLRIAAPVLVLSGDIEQAFYHVRLHQTLVSLRLGDGRTVLSDRMTFGLAFGTGTLDFILALMRKAIYKDDADVLLQTFVDDFLIAANPHGVTGAVELFDLWLHLLDKTGMSCNAKKFSALTAEPYAAVANHPLLNKNMKDSIEVVGTNVSIEGDKFCVMCAEDALPDLSTDTAARTKKWYFKVAGKVGYDPTGMHPERRQVADSIRSIIGSVNVYPKQPKRGWDELVKLDNPVAESNLEDALTKIETLRREKNERCIHASPLNDGKNVRLVLNADASDIGGGYLVAIEQQETSSILLQNKWRWADKFKNTHSNVKELRALCKGIRTLANIIVESSFMRKPIEAILIRSDNQTTVAWLNTNHTKKLRECMMRRTLSRLVESVKEEVNYLQGIAVTTVTYIKGTDNEIADALSRDTTYSAGANVTEASDTLLAQLATRCRSVQEMRVDFLGLKKMTKQWSLIAKNQIDPEDAEIEPVDEVDLDPDALWKCVQIGCEEPSYVIREDDLWVVKDVNFLNQTVKRVWIPEEKSDIINLIIRDTHRTAAHASVDNTCARIREIYSIRKLKSKVRYYVKNCLICQRREAKPGQALAETKTTKDKYVDAYEQVELDVVYINKDFKVLTVTCRSTGHVTWVTVEDEQAKNILKALQRATLICGTPRLVYTDGASYFRPAVFRKYFEGCAKQAPYAPWEGGLHETMHKLGTKVMQGLIQARFAKGAPKTAIEREWLLRQVCIILNTRPLSICREQMVTPDMLAMSYTRKLNSAEYQIKYGKKLSAEEIRKKFYQTYLIHMRERSLHYSDSSTKKTWKPQMNEDVLVYCPVQGKETCDWKIGKITDIYTRRVNLLVRGKNMTVNIGNIAPLHMDNA